MVKAKTLKKYLNKCSMYLLADKDESIFKGEIIDSQMHKVVEILKYFVFPVVCKMLANFTH